MRRESGLRRRPREASHAAFRRDRARRARPAAAALTRVAPIAAIMVHVGDVAAAQAWYRRAFPRAIPRRDAAMAFDYLEIDGVPVELVPADAKVVSGACGSVVYWRVDHLPTALAHFDSVGAARHRGPMRIGGGQAMCQVRDPWGNCIGLRGPAD